ncbi:hypothetical protein U4E84_13945 [Halorubrum sp. AD140]|uniref:hypothetical protein n=1 Tax=Halorubrum sp. AD140 TaxID=3050073 RepID=UPI002ACCB1E9|nr:hypothetical protein [Halorubrum sp. AD140]MDZ5812448.1 hypothetical protein [Halorubrum sp. AD140]
MRRFPPLPHIDDSDAPDDLLEGHLWLLELIDGTGLRFSMDESGLLRFGGPETTDVDLDAVPLALRPAVRHVRGRFDREALRGAVAAPAAVTFLGVATHHRGTDYDWDRIPPFLGTDVWVGADGEETAGADTGDGAFRPPDAAAAIFEGVGLDPVNAVAREVNARDFDPDEYAVPTSAWRDGPAAGVVVRNKRGGRGRIGSQTDDGDDAVRAEHGCTGGGRAGAPADPDDLAAIHAGREGFERVVAALERRGEPATVEPLRVGDGDAAGVDAVDPARLRSAVVERARAFLDGRADE